MSLTEKQRRFVNAYMGDAKGNATEAARIAGYKGNANTLSSVGVENLRKPAIAAAIAAVVKNDPAIMSRDDRQRLYSEIARDKKVPTRDRLRAAELLGKTQGDFHERNTLPPEDSSGVSPDEYTTNIFDPKLE